MWTIWHLPLNAVYLAQGTLSAAEITATTIGIAFWAPLLAALVEVRGTVWPSVFAHAVPVSSLQLLDAGVLEAPVQFWTATVVGWAAMLAAAVLVRAQSVRRPVATA